MSVTKRMPAIIAVVIIIGLVIAIIVWRNFQVSNGNAHESQVAEIKIPHSGNVLLVPIGLETLGGLFDPIFEAGVVLPQTKEQIYTTATDNQQAVDIRILQGFRPLIIHNRVLAELQLTNIPDLPRGVPKIKTTFRINEQGTLIVTAVEEYSGRAPQVTTLSSMELTSEQLESMKQEAAQHAQEDAQTASLIRTQNQAELMVYVARNHVLTYALPSGDASIIQAKVSELEAVRTSSDKPTIVAKMDALQSEMERVVGKRYNRSRGIFEP